MLRMMKRTCGEIPAGFAVDKWSTRIPAVLRRRAAGLSKNSRLFSGSPNIWISFTGIQLSFFRKDENIQMFKSKNSRLFKHFFWTQKLKEYRLFSGTPQSVYRNSTLLLKTKKSRFFSGSPPIWISLCAGIKYFHLEHKKVLSFFYDYDY